MSRVLKNCCELRDYYFLDEKRNLQVKTDKESVQIIGEVFYCRPVPVAERSKARVYGRSLAGIVGSNPAGGMDVCLL